MEGREREKLMGETSIGCLLPYVTKMDQTDNLGMCPKRELNPQSFGVQSSKPTQLSSLGGNCKWDKQSLFPVTNLSCISKVTKRKILCLPTYARNVC